MARIKTYQIVLPTDSDIIIGTDKEDANATRNFQVASLSKKVIDDYFAKVSWEFIIQDPSPSPIPKSSVFFSNFGGAGTNWSSITELEFNTAMVNASSSLPYLLSLVGEQVSIRDRESLESFAVFELVSLTQIGSSTVYKAELNFVSGNGFISAEHYYYLEADPLSSGDKTEIFTQTIPSSTWNISHSLNKFPSVFSVDTGLTQIYGELEYVDNKNIIIRFSSPQSGEAFLN
ncbi:MAG: hypothetical protein GOVbin2056_65 [Prokaryotic dsDNA virus sp.]|nr:MAG: hypothetical protein GOVbin2056_65 [Prokaryotic dsDNA virus sp.]|tara:strand:+ start:8901 stop:9596 length:696 start_codon:yes stop_codon:yes gene_type:complete